MRPVAVGGEPAGEAEFGLPVGDEIQHPRPQDPADQLGEDVRRELRGREPLSRPQPNRYGGVEMTPRDMPNRVGHDGQDREPEGQRHPDEPNPRVGKAAARTAPPQPPNTSQNVPTSSATDRFMSDMAFPLPW
jgi:hypothetical protein